MYSDSIRPPEDRYWIRFSHINIGLVQRPLGVILAAISTAKTNAHSAGTAVPVGAGRPCRISRPRTICFACGGGSSLS
jgi:hypothetical protein